MVGHHSKFSSSSSLAAAAAAVGAFDPENNLPLAWHVTVPNLVLFCNVTRRIVDPEFCPLGTSSQQSCRFKI